MQNNEIRQEDEDTIDLLELFNQMIRHWILIAVAAVLGGAIAFVLSRYLMTPQYESTAKLYVLSKSTSVTSLADIQLGSNLANDYVQVVASRPVLDQVIKDLQLSDDYKSLKSKLTVVNPSNTRILEITIKDASPYMAKMIVDDITDVSAAFIAEKMDQAPPSVFQYGYSDEGKVSPSVSRNTVIGALLAAIIVMAIITVTFLVNDTLVNPEEVESKLGLTLLGTLPVDKVEYNEATRRKRR